MKEIIIKPNDEGQRADRFLMKLFPDLPMGMLYKAIRNKKIKVNRKRCTNDQRLHAGDQIQLFLPPQWLEEKKATVAFLQVPKALSIVYEDDQIVVIDKPVGLRSQSDQAQVQELPADQRHRQRRPDEKRGHQIDDIRRHPGGHGERRGRHRDAVPYGDGRISEGRPRRGRGVPAVAAEQGNPVRDGEIHLQAQEEGREHAARPGKGDDRWGCRGRAQDSRGNP